MENSIPILVNDLAPGARADEADVLVQAEAVRNCLKNLGYQTFTVRFTESIGDLRRRFRVPGMKAVFNLVEAVRGENALQHMAPRYLERIGIPFTGNGSAALRKTTHKINAKELMKRAGIPTPWCLTREKDALHGKDLKSRDRKSMIFKPVEEDASVGIREDLIGPYRVSEALEVLGGLEDQTGMSYMAEEYIDGREFNVSLIETAGIPAVLPLVEQDFSMLPPASPRVVGYRAKWIEDSMEYASIPRNYDFQSADKPLLDETRRLALSCWNLFGLSGYARVDFRIDVRGRVFVLEVNANPCLSPDAGFVFSAGLAGLTMDDTVKLILDAALVRTAPNKIHRVG